MNKQQSIVVEPPRSASSTGRIAAGTDTVLRRTFNPDVKKKWEIFGGRTKFFCGGRLLLSHQYGIFLLTLLLICATNVLFFVFDCPYLARNASIAIPIVGAVLFTFVFISLMKTAFSDPGILPRSWPDEAAYWETRLSYFIADSTTHPTDSNTVNRVVARYLDIQMKDHVLKLKWCHTCRLFRPPRSSHCSVCDNCVDHFDHHCPWVGNCVGRRNYRYFYNFIVVLSILALYILACNIAHLVLRSQSQSFVDAIRQTPATLIEAIVCFLSLWSLLGLMGYHTYLVSKNMTTNEDIKGGFPSSDANPPTKLYSEGSMLKNFFNVLCGPVPPSLLDATGDIDDRTLTMIRDGTLVPPTHPQNANSVPVSVGQNLTRGDYPRAQAISPRRDSTAAEVA